MQHTLEEINEALSLLGYSHIGVSENDAISRTAGTAWHQWVDDCVKLKAASQHWDNLRSCLLAVSATLNMVLVSVGVDASLERRVAVLMSNGMRLRAAIATYLKSKESSAKLRAFAVIDKAFRPPKGPLAIEIESKVHRVFAAKTAVVFEHAHTKEGQACMQIEAAERETSSQGFDWHKKIILQLKDSELLHLMAVLKNWKSQLEIANHGQALDKRLTLRKQDGAGYFLSVRQGTVARAIPIPAFEAFKIVSLALRVLLENDPHLSVESIWSMCEQLAADGNSPALVR